MRLVILEVERRRELPARVDELHAVLLDEMARLHLRQHVQPLQHPVGFRDERFADVKTRKPLALEQLDLDTLLRQQRRHRRPRRTTTNHHDVSHQSSAPYLSLACRLARRFGGSPKLAGFPASGGGKARAPASCKWL